MKAGIIVYDCVLIINNFLKCTAKIYYCKQNNNKLLLMLTISKNAELSVQMLIIIKYSRVIIVQLMVMQLLVIQ